MLDYIEKQIESNSSKARNAIRGLDWINALPHLSANITYWIETNGQEKDIADDFEMLCNCLANINMPDFLQEMSEELCYARHLFAHEDELNSASEGTMLIVTVNNFLSKHLALSLTEFGLRIDKRTLFWVERFVSSSTQIDDVEKDIKSCSPIYVATQTILRAVKARI